MMCMLSRPMNESNLGGGGGVTAKRLLPLPRFVLTDDQDVTLASLDYMPKTRWLPRLRGYAAAPRAALADLLRIQVSRVSSRVRSSHVCFYRGRGRGFTQRRRRGRDFSRPPSPVRFESSVVARPYLCLNARRRFCVCSRLPFALFGPGVDATHAGYA